MTARLKLMADPFLVLSWQAIVHSSFEPAAGPAMGIKPYR